MLTRDFVDKKKTTEYNIVAYATIAYATIKICRKRNKGKGEEKDASFYEISGRNMEMCVSV